MINKAKVLIAEDEFITAMDFKKTIQDIGCEVTAVVSTGEGMIENALKNIPTLILADINLKGEIDGIEAIARLRETHDIPFIYITAFRDFQRVVEIYNQKPLEYIIKPVKSEELAEIVKGCLEQIEAENHK